GRWPSTRQDTTPAAVPGPLARAAEWIARTDPPTARRIARYSSIASIRWDPAAPGVIELTYFAQCTQAGLDAPPGTRLAEDGVCIDSLRVVVDVGTGRALEAVER